MTKTGEFGLQVTLGRAGRRTLKAPPFAPILVLGPPGSRKTTGICIPALLDWPGPALITSLGTDIIEQTHMAREGVGEVTTFDPTGTLVPEIGTVGTWTPLIHARTWDGAQTVARAMIDAAPPRPSSQPTWHYAGIRLLAPHLFAAAANGYLMKDVVRWLDTQEEFEVRSLLQATGVELAIAAAEGVWNIPDPHRNAIYAETSITLQDWWKESFLEQARATGDNRITNRLLAETANTVYICLPRQPGYDGKSISTTAASMLIREAFAHNHGFASSELDLNGAAYALRASRGLVRPFLLILDDTVNVAPPTDLNELISTANKAAVQVISTFTDISQMKSLYSDAEVNSIINNHSVVLILPGSRDQATLSFVERMLHAAPLVSSVGHYTGDRIPQLAPGQALCIARNQSPAVLNLRSSAAGLDLLKPHRLRSRLLARRAWLPKLLATRQRS